MQLRRVVNIIIGFLYSYIVTNFQSGSLFVDNRNSLNVIIRINVCWFHFYCYNVTLFIYLPIRVCHLKLLFFTMYFGFKSLYQATFFLFLVLLNSLAFFIFPIVCLIIVEALLVFETSHILATYDAEILSIDLETIFLPLNFLMLGLYNLIANVHFSCKN